MSRSSILAMVIIGYPPNVAVRPNVVPLTIRNKNNVSQFTRRTETLFHIPREAIQGITEFSLLKGTKSKLKEDSFSS